VIAFVFISNQQTAVVDVGFSLHLFYLSSSFFSKRKQKKQI